MRDYAFLVMCSLSYVMLTGMGYWIQPIRTLCTLCPFVCIPRASHLLSCSQSASYLLTVVILDILACVFT